ncbi:MAG: hypothetical protein J6V24_02000, partial [Clostridia bacterium]|nr:hypothetical protein [Clostridia bacterium]
AYFGGIYNGAGHTLTVNLDTTGQTSIFPYITGVILNLKLAGSMVGDSSTQPIRTIQAGAVVSNVVVEMSIISNGGVGCGLCYTQYGTLFNVYVTGVARSKAVYNTNDGGQYYHVFTNVTKSTDGSALTHSTTTASNDLEAIAAAFNDREDDDFTAGLSALTAACMELTEEALGEVTVDDGVLILSDGVVGGGDVPELTGSGTQEDPYVIETAKDFMTLTMFFNASSAESAAYGSGQFFSQTADIDMTGYEGYEGTHANGNAKCFFGGIYDGNGHTLTVNIEKEGQTSVFPYITGAIINLKITGSIDSGSSSSSNSAQPIRTMQAGSVVANCVFEMNLTSSKPNGAVYSLYGTLFNVYVTGNASGTTPKAVYNSISGGKCCHVFNNVVNDSGTQLTHSTTTASDDLDEIAAAFNDRSDEDFTSGIAALTTVNAALTADVLLPVHSDGTAIVFGEAEEAFTLGVYDKVFTSAVDGVNKATVIGSLTCASIDDVDVDCIRMTVEFKDGDGEVVKTKVTDVYRIYSTLTGFATVSDSAATAQGIDFIDATYIYGYTVKGVPAGAYTVFVTVEAISGGETVASASAAAPIAIEF